MCRVHLILLTSTFFFTIACGDITKARDQRHGSGKNCSLSTATKLSLASEPVTYEGDIRPALAQACTTCHYTPEPNHPFINAGGIILDSFDMAKAKAQDMRDSVTNTVGSQRASMPSGVAWTEDQRAAFQHMLDQWMAAGYPLRTEPPSPSETSPGSAPAAPASSSSDVAPRANASAPACEG